MGFDFSVVYLARNHWKGMFSAFLGSSLLLLNPWEERKLKKSETESVRTCGTHIRSYEPKVAQASGEYMAAISKIWGMKKTKSPLWKTVITKSSFHLSRRGCKMIRKNSLLYEMPHTCWLGFTKEGTVWPRHDTVLGREASWGVFGREAAEQDEGLF